MPQWAFSGTVFLAAALMIYNIFCFVRFARHVRAMEAWKKNSQILNLPIVLLALFLLGYLMIGFFESPNWVEAGVLFGGSIFVYIMYRLLNSITQRIIESEHLEAKLLAAEESSRAKSSFLASISHEMRTPLNIILGMDHIALQNKKLPEETRNQLDTIGHSARHLAGLIDSALDLQRMKNGELIFSHEAFSLREALERVSAMTAPRCREKGLTYHATFAVCAARDYTGDAVQLERALMCLLDNAIKYTDAPGAVTFNANCVRVDDKCTEVRVTVSDTGIGIAPDFLPHIFDSFTREDSSFTSRVGGSGMGLSVAKGIITQMGGSITAESEKGQGSAFTITLPFKAPEICKQVGKQRCKECKFYDHATKKCAYAEEAPPAKPEAAAVSLAGRRILIVEDMPENAEIVADLLELEDAESERAENGQEAVDMLRAADCGYYDAILMDLRMPVMDGLEAARQIRGMEHPDARRIPIIALTANVTEEDVNNCKTVGMNAHLAKPVDADLLYETLKRWIYEAR